MMFCSKSNNADFDYKSLVQITASNEEIERRIAAFCEYKREEINENNRREYCNVFTEAQNHSSCARTDAVFVPRVGCTGHVKVSHVTNPYGPQTLLTSPSKHDSADSSHADASAIVDERLKNIETHLGLSEELSHGDINKRLKTLEEKILYLESLSPEYFNHLQQIDPKKPKLHHGMPTYSEEIHSSTNDLSRNDDGLTVAEIDEEIKMLRQQLRSHPR